MALVALMSSAVLVSCDKDDDKPRDDQNTATNSYLVDGEWTISHMTDDGVDQTASYAGYTFKFTSDGKLTATKGEDTINGIWRTKKDDGRNELEIRLTTTDPLLDEINDDWDIVSSTNSKIELRDDDDDPNEDDILHFTKK